MRYKTFFTFFDKTLAIRIYIGYNGLNRRGVLHKRRKGNTMTVFRVGLDRYEEFCEKYHTEHKFNKINKEHPVYCLIADDAEGAYVSQKIDPEVIAKYEIGLRYDDKEQRLYIEGKSPATYECDEVRFQIAYGYISDHYFEVKEFLFKNGELIDVRYSRIYDRPIDKSYEEQRTVTFYKGNVCNLVNANCHYENLSYSKAYPKVITNYIKRVVHKYNKEVR